MLGDWRRPAAPSCSSWPHLHADSTALKRVYVVVVWTSGGRVWESEERDLAFAEKPPPPGAERKTRVAYGEPLVHFTDSPLPEWLK